MAILRRVAAISLAACASDAAEVPSAGSAVPPTDGFHFASTFSFGEAGWTKSAHPDYDGQVVEVLRDGDLVPPLDDDMAMMLVNDASKYGVAGMFRDPLDAAGKTLVLQYEVKLNKGLRCGGAYLKLLQDPYHDDDGETKPAGLEAFSGSTPYTIMFGPDHCAETNKVHFIYQHKNPVSGAYEEHHAQGVPPAHTDSGSHLYTLVVRPDQSFEVLVDLESKLNGSLAHTTDVPTEVPDPNALQPDDWDEDEDGAWEAPLVPNPAFKAASVRPPIGGEPTMFDATDLKPVDWVDDAQMPDPDAVKPDDWDEDEPPMIDDPNEHQPSDWLPDEPLQVPDPNALQPDDWDEDEDGAWEAPMIDNPKCSTGKCGVWRNPEMHNPKYKGKWWPPLVDNPAFKGVWHQKRIPNPHYFVDPAPAASMAPMAAVAAEVWTMQGGIRLDNVVVCTDCEAEAKAFAEATWRPKLAMETTARAKDAEAKKKEDMEKKRTEGGLKNAIEVATFDLLELGKANQLACLATFLALLAALVFWCAKPDYDSALGHDGDSDTAAASSASSSFAASFAAAAADTPAAAAAAKGDDDGEADENALSAAAGMALESPEKKKGPTKRKAAKKTPKAAEE